jgi:hypothetical protein
MDMWKKVKEKAEPFYESGGTYVLPNLMLPPPPPPSPEWRPAPETQQDAAFPETEER